MSRVCTVCVHANRPEIDRLLVSGESIRNIAKQFGVSPSAVDRHRKQHLPDTLVHAKAQQDDAAALDVMTELERLFSRTNLLFDACDRWLRDPANEAEYDIGPRANEIDVVYTVMISTPDGRQFPQRRKAPLNELLAQVNGDGREVILVESRVADPRDLVLKTARQLQRQIELLGKLMGEIDDRPVVNVTLSPQWIEIRTGILGALRDYPTAAQAVVDALEIAEGSVTHADR